MSHRTERDSLGPVEVPSDKYYGAQTQRSLNNFKIGTHHFPREFIRAYGILKKSAATVNNNNGRLEDSIKDAIHKMLVRENRLELFENCMKFLPSRIKLDEKLFTEDIFAH